MEIDVRKKSTEFVSVIRFTDHPVNDCAVAADTLVKHSGDCPVWVSNSRENDEIIGIRNQEDALNLIEALKKSIDLGWFQ